MASLADHKAAQITKLMVIGDSGTGKTGGLASLVFAGYKLWVMDFDDGMDVLANAIRAKDPKLLTNVEFETFKNSFTLGADGKMRVKGSADAINRAMKTLEGWVPKLGPQDVLVLDSATFMGRAAMAFILQLVGREGKPEIQDWGAAMDICEKAIAKLMEPSVKCNVVVNTHINWTESEGGGVVKGYPNVLGNKLSPIIGGYFNTVLAIKTQRSGTTVKREYVTQGYGLIEGKCSVPTAPLSFPHETGLADFFKLAKGG
jgi:hypothetical protein